MVRTGRGGSDHWDSDHGGNGGCGVDLDAGAFNQFNC